VFSFFFIYLDPYFLLSYTASVPLIYLIFIYLSIYLSVHSSRVGSVKLFSFLTLRAHFKLFPIITGRLKYVYTLVMKQGSFSDIGRYYCSTENWQ